MCGNQWLPRDPKMDGRCAERSRRFPHDISSSSLFLGRLVDSRSRGLDCYDGLAVDRLAGRGCRYVLQCTKNIFDLSQQAMDYSPHVPSALCMVVSTGLRAIQNGIVRNASQPAIRMAHSTLVESLMIPNTTGAAAEDPTTSV